MDGASTGCRMTATAATVAAEPRVVPESAWFGAIRVEQIDRSHLAMATRTRSHLAGVVGTGFWHDESSVNLSFPSVPHTRLDNQAATRHL